MKLCRRKSEKRADRVIHPYMVRRKIGGTGGQSRPPLHGAAENRRNGRTGASAPTWCGGKSGGTGGQSCPPLQGTAENRRNGRTGASAPTGAAENRRSGRTGASAPTGAAGKSEERADRVVRPYKVQKKIAEAGGRGRPPLRGAVRGSLRKIHEYSLVYTAKVWYSETQQWRSILVGPTGIGEGPKNPLKGISMKPVVSASYAQSGVDAGGRHFLPAADGPVPMAWEARDPAAVETGYCAEAYSLCGQRPLYGTGLNLHCGATRLRAVNAVCSVACLA